MSCSRGYQFLRNNIFSLRFQYLPHFFFISTLLNISFNGQQKQGNLIRVVPRVKVVSGLARFSFRTKIAIRMKTSRLENIFFSSCLNRQYGEPSQKNLTFMAVMSRLWRKYEQKCKFIFSSINIGIHPNYFQVSLIISTKQNESLCNSP